MKALKWLDEHFEEAFLCAFLAAICVVELAQVIIRKIPFIPALTWAEEFCRFLWVRSVFISLPYTIRRGNMLRVTALPELLPPKGKKLLDIFADLAVLISMAFCACHSVTVVSGIAKSGETSPAMLRPMWFVYSFMVLGFALGTLRGVRQLICHLSRFSEESQPTEGGGS